MPMGVDDDAMILAPALVPEKGEQPMTRTRHRNSGLRKRCGCSRKVWPKCPHSWFLNFKPRGGPPYRLSLDRELGRRVESKSEAESAATMIRAAILAGTFHVSTSTTNAAASLTFGDVAVRYLDAYVRSRLRPRSFEQAMATTRTTLQQARKKFEQHRSRCTSVAQTGQSATEPASDENSQLQQ
jgi:hypothetical protein